MSLYMFAGRADSCSIDDVAIILRLHDSTVELTPELMWNYKIGVRWVLLITAHMLPSHGVVVFPLCLYVSCKWLASVASRHWWLHPCCSQLPTSSIWRQHGLCSPASDSVLSQPLSVYMCFYFLKQGNTCSFNSAFCILQMLSFDQTRQKLSSAQDQANRIWKYLLTVLLVDKNLQLQLFLTSCDGNIFETRLLNPPGGFWDQWFSMDRNDVV